MSAGGWFWWHLTIFLLVAFQVYSHLEDKTPFVLLVSALLIVLCTFAGAVAEMHTAQLEEIQDECIARGYAEMIEKTPDCIWSYPETIKEFAWKDKKRWEQNQ
ncbi:MAG: hypothetical protein AB1403_10920 [Candidatus Riflebacteria bacterium]